ncbi:NADP-dependent alcohol dehydrogenase [Marmoricola endophyticus]|uniref:alcohol dehydrogenase (NADP(+)) n=1 Tax=Marmoricola endophyticus TaxID=2040280 RepID=A0A917BLE4_9ACTN|nr:NAD(P)-dependent alcohol dehydrogenase [Marmoricola endophyticus]GGF48412.1 NADP-dependent alcohol dehydrogenase [Marmoricola endophyticus]
MRETLALLFDSAHPSASVETIRRRDLRDDDVALDVWFCGVCASDLHAIEHAHSHDTPLVPGHEMTGRVSAVGPGVSDLRPGDLVAVGNIVDSCGECEECRAGLENYCRHFPTPTYGGTDRRDGTVTCGGWSGEMVARSRFVHRLPAGLDAAAAAPLMCAGVTVWEPLRNYAVGRGSRVGVVGLGGLGHLAIRFAVALGAHVTVFTTSPTKVDAASALGAHDVVVSSDTASMQARGRTLDLVVDTGSGSHDPSPYLDTLRIGATMCVLGIAERIDVSSFSLRWGRHQLTGSGTGSVRSTREMLAFAADHAITAEVELLPASAHEEAQRRLRASDVRWRFVLDLRTLGRDRSS